MAGRGRLNIPNRNNVETLLATRGRIITNPGGGDCLFHAVRDSMVNAGLLAARTTDADVRRTAVSQFRQMVRLRPNSFGGNNIGGGRIIRNANEYALEMSKPGTWGGEPEILALSEAYHVRIVAVGSEGTPPRYVIAREYGDAPNPRIYIYMRGATRGRETHWEGLVTTSVPIPVRVSTLLGKLRPGAKTPAPKPSGGYANAENIANAIVAGFVNKPAVSNLGSPVAQNGYTVAGTLYWLGKPRAHVYTTGSDKYYVYVRSQKKFAQRFGKWKIAPIAGTKDGFTLVWDGTLEITTRRQAALAGATAGSFGSIFGRSMNLTGNVANAFINAYMLTNKGRVPAGNHKWITWGRKAAGGEPPKTPSVNKTELAGDVGKAIGKNVSANNIAKAIANTIDNALKPPAKEEEPFVNKLKRKLSASAATVAALVPGGEPPKPTLNMNTIKKIYEPIVKNQQEFWKFYNRIKDARDEILTDELIGMFTYLKTLDSNFNRTINKENPNLYKEGNKKTTIKTALRKLAIERITKLVEDPKINPNFRYELVGNYQLKINRLNLYRLIPDVKIQEEAEYHLKRFKLSQRTGVRRPLRTTGGYGYGGGGGYEGAIYGANRNYNRYMRTRRPSRYNNDERRRNNRNRLERLLREKGLSENALKRLGEPGEYEKYRTTSGNNKAEYNALKKLTQPQVPAAPVELPPLPGVSAKTEESILKHLTPTQQVAVNRAGNLAAVNRILKAAGGTEKVGQAAEILKQVPKNEALKLHLVSKKAAAAVDLFGGPNKAEAAVKVNKKIMSARKKKKGTPKKKKTPVKTKVMKKPAPVPPLRTKVLKNVIAQVPKEKLIDIAGKTTLGIYKSRTPKKVVVNDFARFVERKPKPQPPAKKKASGPRPQPKPKAKKIKKTKAKK